MTLDNQDSAVAQLIAKCLTDETFKQQLVADPLTTLTAAGFSDPANIQASAEFKNAMTSLVHSINGEGELSDLMLDSVAGGGRNSANDW
jgi:hypothetical protein